MKVVGAKGFEPSTSWSQTRDKIHLSRSPGVSYSFSSRSLLGKFGQVPLNRFGADWISFSGPDAFGQIFAGRAACLLFVLDSLPDRQLT